MPILPYFDYVKFKADMELHPLDIMWCLKLQTAVKVWELETGSVGRENKA